MSRSSLGEQIQAQLDKLTDQLTRGIVEEDDYVRQRDILQTLGANFLLTDNTLTLTPKK